RAELFDGRLQGPLDFEPPDQSAREYVAGPHRGDRDVGEPENPPGVIVSYVARQLARPRNRPDEAVFDARAPWHDADAFEPGLNRCALEEGRERRIELRARPRR